MKILVTGAAGFIGFHLSKALLHRGDQVTGLDNLNDYYEVKLKQDRLSQLKKEDQFTFIKADVSDHLGCANLFSEKFDTVVHLAAQAGVRYSLENPKSYITSNVMGFLNILEFCRTTNVPHLVYASSSSVYGANTNTPFSIHQNTNHPVSLYGATKKSNELMAFSYAHLYQLPSTGLRFFTVYGPWGRPDMAYFKFAKKIMNGEPIELYNHGKMMRDFTYIDDAVAGILQAIGKIATPSTKWNGSIPDPGTASVPARIYNLGNNQAVGLSEFVRILEKHLGIKGKINSLPMQPGDVRSTLADLDDSKKHLNYMPKKDLDFGLEAFCSWYVKYYEKSHPIVL